MRIALTSASRAEDAGYRAIADIATLAGRLGAEYRLVGGQMVALLVAVYGATDAPARATADADLGASHEVIGNPNLLTALAEMGYRREHSNTFALTRGDGSESVIDVLGPSGGTTLQSASSGDMVYDAIPGLRLALARSPVRTGVDARLTDGDQLAIVVDLPDPISALVLKALAWGSRKTDKDAFDIWRLLEVGLKAEVGPEDFAFGSKLDAATVLRKDFGRPGMMGVRHHPPAVVDRVTALIARLIGTDG